MKRFFTITIVVLLAIAAMAQNVILPQFPGGEEAMKQWIDTYMYYPHSAIEKGVEGRCTVVVYVTETGAVDEVERYSVIDPALEQEAIRVCKTFPKFKPAMRNGKPVRSQLFVNVDFVLPELYNAKADYVPEYPGGLNALMRFLYENVNYPVDAVLKKIEGQSVISFVVNISGEVEDVKVLKSSHPLLDAEAVRVCGLLKGFNPAIVDGVPVKMSYVLPVNFKLGE